MLFAHIYYVNIYLSGTCVCVCVFAGKTPASPYEYGSFGEF